MDFDLHDAHSRVLAELADALMFRRLCELVAAHQPEGGPMPDTSPAGPVEQVARHLDEVERREARRRSHTIFGDRHDGLGPTIGMDLGTR